MSFCLPPLLSPQDLSCPVMETATAPWYWIQCKCCAKAIECCANAIPLKSFQFPRSQVFLCESCAIYLARAKKATGFPKDDMLPLASE